MSSKIPMWANLELVENVLKNDPCITGVVRNISFKCEPAVNNGENYSSELYRLQVEGQKEDMDWKKFYIVKQAKDVNTDSGKNLLELNVFKKEIEMYSETLIKITQVLKTIGCDITLCPKFVYRCNNPVELFVMEDLLENGFQTPNRHNGLNEKQCELALDKLACFHAASMYLNKQNAEYRNTYNKGCFHEGMAKYLCDYFVNGVKQSIDVMRNLPECAKYIKGYESYSDSMIERGINMSQIIPSGVEDFNVLCHGDFWLNNIMFKYDEHQNPIDVIFVDFQMCTFNNPGFDLNYFFFTSPTDQTRRNFREKLLMKYVDRIADVLKKLNYDGLIPCFDDLKRKLFECRDIAIMTPMIVLPIVKLSPKHSETITTELLMKSKETEMGDGLYNNPLYKEALKEAVLYLSDINYITEERV